MTAPDTSALPGTTAAPMLSPSSTYPRKDDGSVNWRALVRPEHLYVKREHEEKVAKLLNKPISALADLGPEDISKVPDKYLVIRKAGILELARLRGYEKAPPEVKHVQRDYVVVQVHIAWLPFEGIPAKVTGGVGEACPENCSKMGAAYLAATAENRAFSRAVRQFLEIDIVSSDELGDGVAPEQESSRFGGDSSNATTNGPVSAMDLGPSGSLQRAAANSRQRFTFEQIKDAAVYRWADDSEKLVANPGLANDPTWKRQIENDPAPWTDWKDVPPRDCLTLIALIKEADKKAAEQEAGGDQEASPKAGSKKTRVAKPAAEPIAA